MLDFLVDIDTKLFLFLNDFHQPFWDNFMMAFTGKIIWAPMYAMILLILYRRFGWKVATTYVVGIVLAIAFTDQLCATYIRPLVERLRPANIANPIHEYVHIVDGYRGGKYGFPSCHAANSFALATICSLLFRMRRFTVFIFVWAALNSYSRLYLGVHYPGDLVIGALVGSLIGALCYIISHRVAHRVTHPANYHFKNEYGRIVLWGASVGYHLSDIMILMGGMISLSIFVYSFIVWSCS